MNQEILEIPITLELSAHEVFMSHRDWLLGGSSFGWAYMMNAAKDKLVLIRW